MIAETRRASELKEQAIHASDQEKVGTVDNPPITRRGFNSWLGFAALAAALGAVVVYWRERKPSYPVKVIAQAGEIPVGGSKIFTYPADDRPCFLLRPADDTYLAFSRLCTHHTCPVFYRPEDKIFACPCHGGIFSATTGAVLDGPPPKPLPQVILERRGNNIVATGFVQS
ncbi:MAG: Rieske (2Fe-2S) protein [Candidatus Acidiferrales bacterium]